MSRKNGGIIGPANTPVGGLFKGLAGGVWRMNDVANFVSNSQWPKVPENIENSCRFDDGSSDYLIRTPSSASNRDLWTLSLWIKRCTLGSYQSIYGVYADSNNQENFGFDDSDRFFWQLYQSGGVVGQLTTNRLFRDTSAWYHIVAVYDSANSTAGNRMRLYVNSVEETSFATDTNPSSGLDSQWNSTTAHSIGRINTTNYIDMYLAEFVHIDGQALDPTSFGETNTATGIWTPKKIGSFTSAGDNSFYLDFKDSSTLGNDASGLNNDFTVNNLTSIDQTTDTCVENFAIINPLDNYYNSATLSEGNLKVTTASSGGYAPTLSTFGVNSGKWYAEVKYVSRSSDNYSMIGVRSTQTTNTNYLGQNTNDYVYYSGNGNTYSGGSASSYGDSYDQGDIIGVYLDLDNNKLYFAKNGTLQNSGTGISITAPSSTSLGNYFFGAMDYGNSVSIVYDWNFGNPINSISSGNTDPNGYGNFEYDPSSGTFDGGSKSFYALNTTNLNTYG